MRSSILLMCLVLLCPVIGHAQANKTNSGDVACAADGSSTQVIPARPGRYSYTLSNTSGNDVRIGYQQSGTVDLTTSNSWLLKAGQPYSDSAPGLFTGRVMCMSTTAGTSTITFNETYR